MITTLIASLVLSVPVIDLKVDGDGYLRFAHEGRIVYAKTAKLTVSRGKLAAITGDPVMPSMEIPDDSEGFQVSLEGSVIALRNGGSKFTAGQLVLAHFDDPGLLHAEGSFLVSSIRPKLVSAGEGMTGVIRMVGKTTEPVESKVDSAKAKVDSTKPKKTIAADVTPTKKNVVPVGSLTIDVHAETNLTGTNYTLGDVADISADKDTVAKISQISLGTAPAIGIRQTVDRIRIMGRLRMAGLDPSKWTINIPAGAVVMRQSQHVTQDQFIECAVNYAKTQVPDGINFASHDLGREYAAPEGKLELKCEQFTLGTNSANTVVAIYVDGRRLNSRTIRLDVTGANGSALTRVSSGTRVKIIIRLNGAVVEISGRTMSSALVGQTVRVTSDNKTTHTGILTNSGVVEVKL